MYDLAHLLGTTRNAVRQAIHRGDFDPTDLEAVAREWARRQGYVSPEDLKTFLDHFNKHTPISHPGPTLPPPSISSINVTPK